MITADTITDEQIRELRDSAPAGKDGKQIREWCDIAAGRFVLTSLKAKRASRERCAEILNERAAKVS